MWKLPPLSIDEILFYLRKSQSDDPLLTVEETLAKHEQMLDDRIDQLLPGQGKVSEKNRHREVVSGETIDGRPELLALLRRIESPKIKAIVCVEPQRLSRGSLKDIGRLVELLRYSNTLVITKQDIYDLRDNRDREYFERELMRGNDYLEYYKRIQQNGRLQSVQNGNYLGTRPPYGFKKTHYKEGKNDCYSLEPIPDEARIVRLIFEMYRDGYGSHKIAKTLNEMGVKTQLGNKWSAESLAKMRRNEHYIGKVVWNKRQNTRTVENGEVVISRPVSSEYLVFPGKHPAIIDQELWDAVQETRDKIPPVKNKAKCVNPFAGLVTCQCGYGMSMRTYKKRDGTERNPPRLLCTNQTNCGTASCLVSEMTDAVVDILKEAIEDFELQIEHNNSDVMELHRQLIEQQEKRLEDLRAQEVAQWDEKIKGAMPQHVFDRLNAQTLQDLEDVRQALCTLQSSLPEPVDYEKKRAMFSDALATLQDPDAPALEKNMLLKNCIDDITYNRAKKQNKGKRWGDPEPMELDVHLRV